MEQYLVFGTLFFVLLLFVTNAIRYDLVALAALLFLTFVGAIPADKAYLGFGNPAVVTVVAVLIISRALENAGLVTVIGAQVEKVGSNRSLQVAVLCSIVLVLSAFINNVGALALMIPVAIQLARSDDRSPSYLLMPMSFAALLGGMTTLIGTPPNLIISDFRRQVVGEPLRMFDFSFVGAGIALAGLAFISLIGWRLVPQRRGSSSRDQAFHVDEYLSEVTIGETSKLIGGNIDQIAEPEQDIVVTGLLREGVRMGRLAHRLPLRAGDVLIVRADSESLSVFAEANQLTVGGKLSRPERLGAEDANLVEAVVTKNSWADRRTASKLRLRDRFDVELLGISRKGRSLEKRLSVTRLQSGDVLLMQMPEHSQTDTLMALGLLPLAQRQLAIGKPRRLALAIGIFVLALVIAAIGHFPSSLTFSAAVLLMILAGIIGRREAYESIDWSIVVLLGAMIPVGQSLETSGGAETVANWMRAFGGEMSPTIMLTMLLVVTMFLSDVINNAAAAVVMAPVSISLAAGLEASPDPFLLAVAIGASCAFLTPIGHQCNTIILGPGGYSFRDYWPMGILLELIVVAVAVPLLAWFWPLFPPPSTSPNSETPPAARSEIDGQSDKVPPQASNAPPSADQN